MLIFLKPGFNIATDEGYEKMMSDFKKIVGMKYLKAIHLNDSKGMLRKYSLLTLVVALLFEVITVILVTDMC